MRCFPLFLLPLVLALPLAAVGIDRRRSRLMLWVSLGHHGCSIVRLTPIWLPQAPDLLMSNGNLVLSCNQSSDGTHRAYYHRSTYTGSVPDTTWVPSSCDREHDLLQDGLVACVAMRLEVTQVPNLWTEGHIRAHRYEEECRVV